MHNLLTLSLVQQLTALDAKKCETNRNGRGNVFLYSSRNVWLLQPLSFMAQIDALVEAGSYGDACLLLERLSSVAPDERRCKLSRIRFQHAQFLFQQRKYDAAMEILIKEQPADPSTILHTLFTFMNDTVDVASVSATEKHAILSLITYLTDVRYRLLQRLRQLERDCTNQIDSNGTGASVLRSRSDPAAATSLSPLTPAPISSFTLEEVHERLGTVDTALLRAYLITNDSLVGSLVRVCNFCDMEASERMLRDANVCASHSNFHVF